MKGSLEKKKIIIQYERKVQCDNGNRECVSHVLCTSGGIRWMSAVWRLFGQIKIRVFSKPFSIRWEFKIPLVNIFCYSVFSQGGWSVSALLHELRAPKPFLGTVVGYPLLLLQEKPEGKKTPPFLCNLKKKKKSKKQMFNIKIHACFSLSHTLSFFQATVPCIVSAAAAGEKVKSSQSEK